MNSLFFEIKETVDAKIDLKSLSGLTRKFWCLLDFKIFFSLYASRGKTGFVKQVAISNWMK